MNQEVIVYTTTLCPICKMVKPFLEINDVPYKELIGKTGKLTVPQTNINGTWISGFHPEKMFQALNS